MTARKVEWEPNLRRRSPFFAAIGLSATALDLGLFFFLEARGLAVVLADVIALTVAAGWAYTLNRVVTFGPNREARWVRRPQLFVVMALVAGIVDVTVVASYTEFGIAVMWAKGAGFALAATFRWVFYRWVLLGRVRRQMAQRVNRPPSPGSLRLSVIVPAYNEESFIANTVAVLREALVKHMSIDDFEVLVVDDGSADDTASVATNAGAKVLIQPTNGGKGAAVRAGVDAAQGRAIVFTDADLAYAPALVVRVLKEVEGGWDLVVGNRRHVQASATVRARWIRQIGGGMVNWLSHLVLLGHFRDTQCGLKGFRGDIGKTLFRRSRIDGFAFDIELFLMAEQDGLSLLEIPVTVENRAGSSVSVFGDGFALLRDLLRIRRWARRGLYRPSPAESEFLAAREAT